jgi:outer membrane immunogenic protein
MKRLTSSALFTLAAVSVASAADLPSKKTTPVAPAAKFYNWGGGYVGLTAGYQMGGRLTGDAADEFRQFIPEAKGGLFGLVGGYNFQSGSWVYGPEFDIGYSLANGKKTITAGTGSASLKAEQSVFGSARGRLGYAFDNVLVFATAGAAVTTLKLSYEETGTGITDSNSETKTYTGYTLGAGLEYGVSKDITARLEYRFTGYPEQKFSGNEKYGLNTHDIRAGVAYKF